MTNINEGAPFVNQGTPVASPISTANYAVNLFPNLSLVNAVAAAKLYSSLGTVAQQASQIMMDCQYWHYSQSICILNIKFQPSSYALLISC